MRRHRRAVATALVLLVAAACSSGKSTTSALPPGEVDPGGTIAPGTDCNWPMWGQNLSRSYSYPCPTTISPVTAKNLEQKWFFNTADVVTATPAVVDGSLYVGDWSGAFYALDANQGTLRWKFQADVAENVYAGQIVASAAVTDAGGIRSVVFADGPNVYALRADNGTVIWKTNIGTGAADDFTEVESSPLVVGGKVIFGSDVHNHKGQKAGVYALDIKDGKQVWFYDGDEGKSPSGCVDVWGSPAADVGRKTVYIGTGSCNTPATDWRPNSEALLAIDVDKGTKKWGYQPHDQSAADLDFAGAPNLFEVNNQALVGLGNKDGTYYALDRDKGSVVWKTEVTKGGPTGGFIGPAVYARGIIAGGTAIGGAPFLHALNAADGKIVWQQPKAQATYAASAEANGVLFSGGTDFTFRAFDLKSGEVLWSKQLASVIAGGAAIVGDDVFAVAGLREPGSQSKAGTSGVYRFSLTKGGPVGTSTTSSSTTTVSPAGGLVLDNAPGPCFGSPCVLGFLKGIPAGVTGPTATIDLTTDPFKATVVTTNLGDPKLWITVGSDAAAEGASKFAVFVSESDETLKGGLLCVLDAGGSCSTTQLPAIATYSRVTILAVNDTSAFPSPADGLARLVATLSFEPPINPKPT